MLKNKLNSLFIFFENIPLYVYYIGISILLLAITIVAYFLQELFYNTHTLFLDPAFYHYYLIQLKDFAESHTIFETIKYEFIHNGKSFFRTLPLLFFPKLLSIKYSFLITGLPIFYFFTISLFVNIYRIQKNKFFAFTFIFLFLCSDILISPIFGITVFWLDLIAGFSIGVVTMHIYLWYKERKKIDLVFVFVFSIITILSRDRIFIFLCAINLPVIIIIFNKLIKKEFSKSNTYLLIGFFFLVFIPLIIRDFIFIYKDYVAGFGYGMHNGISKAFDVFSTVFIKQFFNQYFLTFILVILLFLVINSNNKGKLIYYLYSILITPFLMVVILQSTEARHVYMGFIPVIFLFPILFPINKKAIFIILSVCLLLIGSINFYINFDKIRWRNMNPNTYAIDSKKLTDIISNKINNDSLTWMSFYDENLLIPQVSAFYENGFKFKPIDYSIFFSIHKTYFICHHKTSDIFTIKNNFINNLNKFDFVLVPEKNQIPKLFNNDISIAVSKAVTNEVDSSINWKLDTIVYTDTYGKISIFINNKYAKTLNHNY